MKNVTFSLKSGTVCDKFCTQIRVATQAEKIVKKKSKYENPKIKIKI
jgi:hypothetical protein